jgi:HlyD family secretion protein
MKRRLFRWFLLILLLVAAGLMVLRWSRPKPIQVEVKPVERASVERTVANTRAGTVEACRRAKLSPAMGGQIARLPIREGDRVKAGQLLLEIWNDDLKANVTLARNEAKSASARAESVCVKAAEARRQADRLVSLRKIKAVAQETTDQAVATAESLKAECASAKASTQMSDSRIALAQANLERTLLVAPFDGVIAQINGELNEYLTPSPPGIPTPPAVDLVDDSCFDVTAPIDEVDAPEIKPGMTARISLDAFGDRRFEGSVRRIAPFVLDREKQARTVDVEAVFTRSEDLRELLAGYSADVEIVLTVRKDVLRVPTEAVLDGKRVFIYDPETGLIQERTFQKGISNWRHTEVLSGLKEGEQVVVNVDQTGLKDGALAEVSGAKP